MDLSESQKEFFWPPLWKFFSILWQVHTVEYGIISTHEHVGMLKINNSSVKRTFPLHSRCTHVAFCIAFNCLNCYRHHSIVIKILSFLLAARRFSPPGAANSQFWLCSVMHKLSPCVTTSPNPEGHGIIIANSILQGSILQLFWWRSCWTKSAREGFQFSHQFSVESFEYAQYRFFGVLW